MTVRALLPTLLALLLPVGCALPPAPEVRGDPARARGLVEAAADQRLALVLPAGVTAGERERIARELARGVPGADPVIEPADWPPAQGAWLVLHPLPAAQEGPDPACIRPRPHPAPTAVLFALCDGPEEVAAVRVAGADVRALWRAARLLLPDPRAKPRPLRLLPHVEVGISGSFGF